VVVWLAVLWVYATQFVAGVVVVRALDFDGSPSARVARALVLGPMAVAVQCVVYSLVAVPWNLALVLVPWWLAGVAIVTRRGIRWSPQPRSHAERALFAGIGIVFALSVWFGLSLPMIAGDAVANFAVFGKLLAVHGGLSADVLQSVKMPGHPEYPPLIAINEALVFRAAAPNGETAIRLFFSFAWLAFAFLTFEAFRELERTLAVLLTALVVATPLLWEFGHNGYADLRLTASGLLLLLECRRWLSRHDRRAALGVALAAAACALTKNEGMMLAGAALAFLLVTGFRSRSLIAAAPAALVMVVLGGLWPAWKLTHGIAEPFLAGAAEQGVDIGRVPRIVGFFLADMFRSQAHGSLSWGVLWPLGGVAIVVCGVLRDRRVWPYVIGFAAHLGVYTAAFVVTPHPLEWHLATAAPRLLLHTLPWLIFVLVCGQRALADRDRAFDEQVDVGLAGPPVDDGRT